MFGANRTDHNQPSSQTDPDNHTDIAAPNQQATNNETTARRGLVSRLNPARLNPFRRTGRQPAEDAAPLRGEALTGVASRIENIDLNTVRAVDPSAANRGYARPARRPLPVTLEYSPSVVAAIDAVLRGEETHVTPFNLGRRESSSFIALDSLPRRDERNSWSVAPELTPRRSGQRERWTDDADSMPLPPMRALHHRDTTAPISLKDRVSDVVDQFSFLDGHEGRKQAIKDSLVGIIEREGGRADAPTIGQHVEQRAYSYLLGAQLNELKQIGELNLDWHGDEKIEEMSWRLMTQDTLNIRELINDIDGLASEVALLNVSDTLDTVLNNLGSLNDQHDRKVDIRENLLNNIREEGLQQNLVGDADAIAVLAHSYLIEINIKLLLPDLPMPEVNRLIASFVHDQKDNLQALIDDQSGSLFQSIITLTKQHVIVDAIENRSYRFESDQAKNHFIQHALNQWSPNYLWNNTPAEKASLAKVVDRELLQREIQALPDTGLSSQEVVRYAHILLADPALNLDELLSSRVLLQEQVALLSLRPRMEACIASVMLDIPELRRWYQANPSNLVSQLTQQHSIATLENWLTQAENGNFDLLVRVIATPVLEREVTGMLLHRGVSANYADLLERVLDSPGHPAELLLNSRAFLESSVLEQHLSDEIGHLLTDSNTTADQREEITRAILFNRGPVDLRRLVSPHNNELQAIVNNEINRVRREANGGAMEQFSQAVEELHVPLTRAELDIIRRMASENPSTLQGLSSDRALLLDFVRSQVRDVRYEQPRARLVIRDGTELESLANTFVRHPQVQNPFFQYQTRNGQIQAGIDAGGLRRQVWSNAFAQLAALPTIHAEDAIDIVPSTAGGTTGLREARMAGHVVAGALSNARHNNLTYLQTFVPRVYDALDHLNFSVNSSRLRSQSDFRRGALVHSIYQACVEPTSSAGRRLHIDLDRNPLTEGQAQEFVTLIDRFLPQLDHAGHRHTAHPATQKATAILDGIKDIFGQDSRSEAMEYVKEQITPLCHFVSGFYDVHNTARAFARTPDSVSDQLKRMMGGRTLFQQIAMPGAHQRGTDYVQIEITQAACTGLAMSPFNVPAQRAVKQHLQAIFTRYVREECNNDSPQQRERATKLCQFITGSQTVNPSSPITLKIVPSVVANGSVVNQPRSHTCFNTLDIPVSMLSGLNARSQGNAYESFRSVMNAVLEHEDGRFGEG